MMTVAHLVAVVLLWLVWSATLPPLPLWSLLVAGVLGLLPDVAEWLDRAVGHRTATHSLLAIVGVAAVGALVDQFVAVPWLLLTSAYATHIGIDLIIGVDGVALLWPLPDDMTLTDWEDDGPAPKRLLAVLLLACVLVSLWPLLAPFVVQPTIDAAVAMLTESSPTGTATATATLTATTEPSIHLSFALPSGVTLSALRVRAGDVLREGQLLAAWEQPHATPSPTLAASPAPITLPLAVAAPAAGDNSATISAKAALTALSAAQPAERTAMLAEQQRESAATQRYLADERQALDLLQPMHERQHAEAQSVVDAAHRALLDQQAAAALADPNDPAAVEQAATKTHQAEATLRAALDSQARMRTAQGIERQQHETAVSQVQSDVEALPAAQAAALAKMDADHASAIARARGALDAAQASAAALLRSANQAQQLVVATMAADRRQLAATATAEARIWGELAEATQTSYSAAANATAQAQAMPAPDRVISRASGRIVAISA